MVFEKPGIFSENLITWQATTTLESNIFFLKLCKLSYLPMPTKRCWGFFIFCLDLELFSKIKKTGFYIHVFYIFINKSRSKQNKKKQTRTHFCKHCLVGNVKISAKNIKLYCSCSWSKFSFFQTNNMVTLKQ